MNNSVKDRIARAYEDEIAILCDRPLDSKVIVEKQKLYTRIGQFLINTTHGHWWCTYPTIMTFMMRLLELYETNLSVRTFYDTMGTQLKNCCKCVDIYHASLDNVRMELEYEFEPDSVKDFMQNIASLDVSRIQSVFSNSLSISAKSPRSHAEQQQWISITIYEILSQRRLLSDFRITRIIANWLAKASSTGRNGITIEILQGTTGIYHYLVSPDSNIRAWATSMVDKIGQLTIPFEETGSDNAFLKIIGEWMYILESNSFSASLLSLDVPQMEDLSIYLEQTNCIKSPTNQVLWAAMDTVIQKIDKSNLEMLLESYENLPDLVFNYINDIDFSDINQQKIAYVIVKCYSSLVICLGHRVWDYASHSSEVVLDIVISHCKSENWHVYVTKQFIQLLCPLVASMRPAHLGFSKAPKEVVEVYLRARSSILNLLINPAARPTRWETDMTLSIAASRAVCTIISHCYEPRLNSKKCVLSESGIRSNTKRKDGELPEEQLFELSVSESYGWWPCSQKDSESQQFERLWMDFIFDIVVNPKNIEALVDHAAETFRIILRKHLYLTKDKVYSIIKASADANGHHDNQSRNNGIDLISNENMGNSFFMSGYEPVIPNLLVRLCNWKSLLEIPLALHGALFESIGGTSEVLSVLNSIETCGKLSITTNGVLTERDNVKFQNCHSLVQSLNFYRKELNAQEQLLRKYLDCISNEVLNHSLSNPFIFPVVAQHVFSCMLSPLPDTSNTLLQLIVLSSIKKSENRHIPPISESTIVESLLQCGLRNTEALVVGMQSIVESLQQLDYVDAIANPILRRLVYYWARIFEASPLFEPIQRIISLTEDSKQTLGDVTSSRAHQLPALISDMLTTLISRTLKFQPRLDVSGNDENLLQDYLELAIYFWKFYSQSKNMKRCENKALLLITPLVKWLGRIDISASTNRGKINMVIELLYLLLTILHYRKVQVKETTLLLIESLPPTISANFSPLLNKLRVIRKHYEFFEQRPLKGSTLGNDVVKDMPLQKLSGSTRMRQGSLLDHVVALGQDAQRNKTKATRIDERIAASKAMSAKSAAKLKSSTNRVLMSELESIVNYESKTRNSFYDDTSINERIVEAHSKRTNNYTSQFQFCEPSNAATNFNLSNVLESMSMSHGSNFYNQGRLNPEEYSVSNQSATGKYNKDQRDDGASDSDESCDSLTNLPLFYRVKTKKKAISMCPIQPFYRSLLQLCMPMLHKNEYEDDGYSKHQREKPLTQPPLSFETVTLYAEAFLPLLLAECKSEIQTGLQQTFASTKQWTAVIKYESEKQSQGMRSLYFSIVHQNGNGITRDSNKVPRRGKLFRKGDVVVIQSIKQKHVKMLGVISVNENQGFTVKSKEKDEGYNFCRVLVLSDSDLENIMINNASDFAVEYTSRDRIADGDWRIQILSNLTTNLREYIALRSIDFLPKHLRIAILTPNKYKNTQSELLLLTAKLDALRKSDTVKNDSNVLKILNKLTELDIQLTDLRLTSIGKAVSRLRKSKNSKISILATKLRDKWSKLMDLKDELEKPPRYLSAKLWLNMRTLYNQSQLQSIHSILSNYDNGVNLLQGPPGTGKTKTIMGLLSGFLALRPPLSALRGHVSASGGKGLETDKEHNPSIPITLEITPSAPERTFSLNSVVPTGVIQSAGATQPQRPMTSIQKLKNAGSSRARLEAKLSSRYTIRTTVKSERPRIKASGATMSCHILLCAPSNGAVDELVLRIVKDGLMNEDGIITPVSGPSLTETAKTCSIVRLGSPGEDAPECVKTVSLPVVLDQKLAMHPKSEELKFLEQEKVKLRERITNWHGNKNGKSQKERGRKVSKPGDENIKSIHSKLTQCIGKIRRLRIELESLKKKITTDVLTRASIVACTLSKAGSGDINSLERGFDVLIIDEAAQAVELSCLVAIRERVARVVLVGDPKQLPATVKSMSAANARYDRSLFERIADNGVAPSMLRIQYRMHPFLRDFPSKRFYHGMLTDGPNILENVRENCQNVYDKVCYQPFLMYNVDSSVETTDDAGSKANSAESKFCVDLLQQMILDCPDIKLQRWSFGIVTPYKSQVTLIRLDIRRSSLHLKHPLISVEVNTVDGFQGREKDVMIISCVRSSSGGHKGIGFLKDIRRLNVAITRARYNLFIIGHVETLRKDPTWSALVDSAQERRLLHSTNGLKSFGELYKRLQKEVQEQKVKTQETICVPLLEHYTQMHHKLMRKAKSKDVSTKNATSIKEEINTEKGSKNTISIKEDTNMEKFPKNTIPIKEDNNIEKLSKEKQTQKHANDNKGKRKVEVIDTADTGAISSRKKRRIDDKIMDKKMSNASDSSKNPSLIISVKNKRSEVKNNNAKKLSTTVPSMQSMSERDFCMENEPKQPRHVSNSVHQSMTLSGDGWITSKRAREKGTDMRVFGWKPASK